MLFIRNLLKNKAKWAIFGLFFCFLIIFLFTSKNNVLAEITVPSAQPPNNNLGGYLQISDIDQAKQGPLRLGTDDIAAYFNYQLEVLGQGADLSNANIDNNLQVSDTVTNTQKTLMVDSENNKVCIGECLGVDNSKLEVSGSGILVNNYKTTGNAVSVYNDSQEAIYGSGISGGIYSIASGDNIAVQGLSTSGTALAGSNINNNYSSVAGKSDNGTAIYGTNTNLLGMWSAYFNGRLEVNTDISAAKIVSKNYPNSLIGFTYGQTVDSYNFGDSKILYHDGTYLWLAQDENILKVRASDGFQIFNQPIGNAGDSIKTLIYDDNYYWAVYDTGVSKISPENGITSCTLVLSDPRGIVFDGQSYWVTENGTGELINIDDSCSTIGTDIIQLVDETEYSLGKIIYDGSSLWALSYNNITGGGRLININPSTKDVMRFDGYLGLYPVDIYFDNQYYWVLNSQSGSITRFYLQDSKICSQLFNDNPYTCESDSQCSDHDPSLGVCEFYKPQEFGLYYLSYDSTRQANTPTNFIFTDKDIWVNNNWVDSSNVSQSELVKMSLYDLYEPESIALEGTTNGLAFDQTYLWVSSSDSDLVKVFSGVGYGSTDLMDTVALQNNNPLLTQWGSFSIAGSEKFGTNLKNEGDLVSDNNVWGDSNSEISGGMSWNNTGDLSGATDVNAIAENSHGTLFAATAPNGDVFMSTDEGANWNNTGDLPGMTDNRAIYIASDDTIFVGGFNNASLYRSTNDGISWDKIDNFPGGVQVGHIVADSTGAIYVSVSNSALVYKSVNNGDNWTLVGDFDGNIIGGMVVTDSDALVVMVRFPNEVHISNDGGNSWEPTIPVPYSIQDLIQASDNSLYAAFDTGNYSGVFRSVDNGNTWQQIGSDFPQEFQSVDTIVESDSGTFYTAIGGNLYSFSPGDTEWNLVTTTGSEIGILFSKSDGDIYAGLRVGIVGSVYKLVMNVLPPGPHSCPNGQFIKNISLNSSNQVIGIECSSL